WPQALQAWMGRGWWRGGASPWEAGGAPRRGRCSHGQATTERACVGAPWQGQDRGSAPDPGIFRSKRSWGEVEIARGEAGGETVHRRGEMGVDLAQKRRPVLQAAQLFLAVRDAAQAQKRQAEALAGPQMPPSLHIDEIGVD